MDESERLFDTAGQHFIFAADKSTSISDISSAGKSAGLPPSGATALVRLPQIYHAERPPLFATHLATSRLVRDSQDLPVNVVYTVQSTSQSICRERCDICL